MTLIKGDVVLVPFPFTDLSQTKLRPAIVLWVESNGNDVILCFVSSQNLDSLQAGEILLDPSEPEFATTKLKHASKIRVARIVTLERRLITRRLGHLEIHYLQQLNIQLIQVFQLS